MNEIAKIEVIYVEDEGLRKLTHLTKPDINILKKIKATDDYKNLQVGKYRVFENFTFERIENGKRR